VSPAFRLAVVGDPISHSRSPAIHNAAFAALGLDAHYAARQARGQEVEQVMEELRRGDLHGVNVTMPLKGVAAALVDDLSPDARRSGSVNTIVRRPDGDLIGHSTDISAMRRLWPAARPAPVLVLGAGGAAAAACLAASGRTLYVSARRPGAVAALAGRLGMDLVEIPWSTAVVEAVVVNATPLGMGGEPLPPRVVPLASSLIDLAYGQATTPAVEDARRLSMPTVDGIEFLVAQAADSFRLWTGREPPIKAMAEAARNPSSACAPLPNEL
jgi:shikimate dehydrogenase